MNNQVALRIVYDLASQNALDLDHQDAELRSEASRQDDALNVVYTMREEMDKAVRAKRMVALDERFTARLTELANIDDLSVGESVELGFINYFRTTMGEIE